LLSLACTVLVLAKNTPATAAMAHNVTDIILFFKFIGFNFADWAFYNNGLMLCIHYMRFFIKQKTRVKGFLFLYFSFLL